MGSNMGTLAIWRSSHKKPLTHSLINWILVIPLQKSIGRLVSMGGSTVPWEKTSLRRHAWTCMVSGVLTPSTLPRMELARLIGLRGKKRTRSGSPIAMSKTHLLITPSRSQMSIGNAMGRRSPNMGSEHSFVALFWDNVAQMRRHDRHPRIFPCHRMLWKTQICSSMGVALQCFRIWLPFLFFL